MHSMQLHVLFSTRYHGKERRKETSYINASLMALKDCIRARASGNASINHIFRKSKLTLALKASFSLVNAVTYVIATVSPTSKDTEHSLNTLRHACIMHGQESKDSETRFITGGTVETEQIGEIDLTRIARKNNAIKRAGGRIDDPKTSNGNTVDKANAAKQEVELTDKEKARAKRIAEKKSISKMPQVVRDLLKRHRYLLGQEQRQTARMRNVAEVGAIDAYMDSPDHEASEVEEEIGHPLAINKPILEAEEVEEEDLKRTGNSEQNYYSDFHDDHKNSRDDEDSVHSTASLEEAQKTLDKPKFGFEMESPPPRALIIKKRNMQREVVVKQRIPFDQLYDSIYSVADDMPEEMLAKQLARLLSIQGYSDEEIQLLTYEREKSTQKAKPQSSAPVRSPSAVNSRTPASNSAEKVKLRSSSAHRNSRLQHKSISSDDITFAKPNDQIKATPQSSNAESNRSKSRQRSVSMSTSPRAAQSISKLVASRVEESDCIMENRSVREVLMRQDENDGVAKAARELELQALKRQKRREAAKAAKDSQISKNSRNVAKTVDNRDNNHVHSQVESEADYHEREIKRLIYEIQNNTDLSTAALHGIKKTIAKHKAAVLKLIRLEEQKRNEAHEEYEEALPQQSSRPDSHRSKSSREKSRNTISKEHSRYDDDGGFVFETNEKKTPVVVNVDEIPVAAARSRPTSRSVAQPKEAPKVVSPPPAQQMVDNVDDDPIFGKNAQKKKFNPRAAALARYGAKQNVGNAINSEADTSEDNQSDNTKEAHVTGKNDNYDQVDQYQDRLPSARSIPLDDYSDRNNYNDYSHHNQQNIIQNAPKDLYIKANYRQLYLPSNLSNGQQNDFNGRKVRPSQYGAASAPFGNAFTEDRF